MNNEQQPHIMLNRIKSLALSPDISPHQLLSAIEDLISWLIKAENNNGENCQLIDTFIAVEIISDRRFNNIQENIRNILFDMGATLHDTYKNPTIAFNFESTPRQLLERISDAWVRIKKI